MKIPSRRIAAATAAAWVLPLLLTGACSPQPMTTPVPIAAVPAGGADGSAPALPQAVGATGAGQPGSLTGSVGGTTLTVASTLAAATADASGGAALTIALSDQANACGLLGAKTQHQGSVMLLIALGASGATVGAGTYSVGDSAHEAVAEIYHVDASCDDSLGAAAGRATGGTVTLGAVGSDGATSGQFHLTFGSAAEPLAGAFTAVDCAALATLVDPTTGASTLTTCQ